VHAWKTPHTASQLCKWAQTVHHLCGPSRFPPATPHHGNSITGSVLGLGAALWALGRVCPQERAACDPEGYRCDPWGVDADDTSLRDAPCTHAQFCGGAHLSVNVLQVWFYIKQRQKHAKQAPQAVLSRGCQGLPPLELPQHARAAAGSSSIASEAACNPTTPSQPEVQPAPSRAAGPAADRGAWPRRTNRSLAAIAPPHTSLPSPRSQHTQQMQHAQHAQQPSTHDHAGLGRAQHAGDGHPRELSPREAPPAGAEGILFPRDSAGRESPKGESSPMSVSPREGHAGPLFPADAARAGSPRRGVRRRELSNRQWLRQHMRAAAEARAAAAAEQQRAAAAGAEDASLDGSASSRRGVRRSLARILTFVRPGKARTSRPSVTFSAASAE
jgi:hypothetical protein